MPRGSWKVFENGEASFIDLDEEETAVKAGHQFSNWWALPDLILEQIFCYLNVRERFYASLVCRAWSRGFYLPQVWSKFIVEDDTLSRGKFNYYSGWQQVLDHLRTQQCLTHVGRYFRELDFRPTSSFHNLFQFMTLVSWNIEEGRSSHSSNEQRGIGDRITNIKYTFPCNMADTDDLEDKLFGTGGQLLAALKRLLNNILHLRRLELLDLLLEPNEARHLLDEVADAGCLTLRKLVLINATRVQCQILHPGVFLNLRVLVISPQNLGDDVVELLGFTSVRHIHILQTRYTPSGLRTTPSSTCWMRCAANNPPMRVHLRLEAVRRAEILWQTGAPVGSITYDSPYAQLDDSLLRTVTQYGRTLQCYGHEGLQRFQTPRCFNDRSDSIFIVMAKQCPHLHTLIIRERISTATVLLIAYSASNLRHLFIRRNAVVLKCDWPKRTEWTTEFYHWLQSSAHSYEKTETEVSKILGYRWNMLSDKLFRSVKVNVQINDKF